MLLGNSIQNDWKNLYLHPKLFKITFKSNSYLMSISRRGTVNTSTSTFPISTLQKQFKIYLLFQNQRKMAAIISISTLFHLTIFQNIYFYFLIETSTTFKWNIINWYIHEFNEKIIWTFFFALWRIFAERLIITPSHLQSLVWAEEVLTKVILLRNYLKKKKSYCTMMKKL